MPAVRPPALPCGPAGSADAGNKVILKLMGEAWRAISEDEKAKFETMAADDKLRYKRELAELRASGADVDAMLASAKAGSSSAPGEFSLPVLRVKRIAKANPKVTSVSSEATTALIMAIGMFVDQIATDSVVEAQAAKRKTVRYTEARTAIRRSALAHFITPADFPAA